MIEQIRAFRRSVEEAVAERRVPSAHGVGLFCDSIPSVYDENYLRIDEPVSATVHVSEADALMEPFWHRRVTFDAPADHLAAGFEELGWTQTGHVVMAHVRDPDRFVDTSRIREVSLDEIAVSAPGDPRRITRNDRARRAAPSGQAPDRATRFEPDTSPPPKQARSSRIASSSTTAGPHRSRM